MRATLACGVLLLVAFAGCSEAPAPESETDRESFEDLDTATGDGTGVILGVVVDQAIVPVPDVDVVLDPSGEARETTTDAEGRFVFRDLEPGSYFLDLSRPGYEAVQTSAQVEADEEKPPVLKVQMAKLFSGQPYMEGLQFNGFFECAYSLGVSSTCVNDYTRLNPGGQCPGGCFPQLSSLVDNREYVTPVGADWKTIVLEMTWEPSLAGTSEELHMTTSYFARPTASHFYSSVDSANPMLVRLEEGVAGPGQNGEPVSPAPEGIEDFFVFMSAASGNIAVEQEFEVFQHTFYHLPPPEGWSLIAGDGNPY